MNSITTKERLDLSSKRTYPMILVDEQPLDIWLNRRCPEEDLGTLVPTLLPWLEETEDRKLVWGRLNALGNTSVAVPLLMGAGDTDLWLTIIIVEMVQTETSILWSRIGIEWGEEAEMPYSIGTDVYWLEAIPALEFDKKQHQQVLQVFNQLMQQEELDKLSDDATQRSSRFFV
ncbi:MAG: hypothetical protein ACRBFS_02625 [Aureispira sp.]